MSETSIETAAGEQPRIAAPQAFRRTARLQSIEAYEQLYQESLHSPETFWRREAADLSLRKPWHTLLSGTAPFSKWFAGAELNVSESCLDVHLENGNAGKVAIIWEGEDGSVRNLTYRELHQEVVQFAAALRHRGIAKGDRVAIYMGMTPEAMIGMLACARIGATHSVVFGGFAADALRERINDCKARAVLTQDAAPRRGKLVPLKSIVDEALRGAPSVETVFVYQRVGSGADTTLKSGRDVDWYDAIAEAGDTASGAAEVVDAEHPLFILYTSGSTGKPKGVLHSSLGYLVGAHITSKYVFDLQPDDIYWCTADIGWITGHSYIVYGPLSNGATCLVYEGAPNFPDWGRFWRIIETHKATILYTAPTAIRAFIKAGDDWVNKHDLSSLRLLGSVGEPINPEAWRWYHETVGKKRCPVVDTWWQTETGSIMMTTLPGVHSARPGSTGFPFFGVEPAVVDSDGNPVGDGKGGLFVIKRPWPSMLRTIWGDDERFERQYFSQVAGDLYFTGDGASIDGDGYLQVVGRIDDVLNVSGHRIGTAEIESSLVAHPAVAEAAAVGRPDDIKGQAIVVFVSLKPDAPSNEGLESELRGQVAKEIGKFAQPDGVLFVRGLPKTRSGKIMRRLLKDIAGGREVQGDTSTLEDASIVEHLKEVWQG